jgi:hypothetical protein
VERCEQLLEKSWGLDPQKDEAWRTCARHEVFDRYSTKGESSEEADCRAAWVECSEQAEGEGPSA